jgi:hypothetical protein
MSISYSKLFVGISLPALCTGLAGLILCSSAHAQTIRPSTQKELRVFDPRANATGNVRIRAAAGTVSYTLTLPAAEPSVNQVLSANDVSGGTVSLTWATPFSGTGTTNYLSKFASASTLTNSLLFDNGTNVGIGTTSPEAKLNIVNTVSANTPQYGGIAELDFTRLSSSLNESFGLGATIKFRGSSGNDSPDNKGLSALSVNAFNSNTGTVDYMQGMYGDIRNLSTGTVTNFSGIRLPDGINSGGGTITNFYGLRIEPQTVGTNRQAISLNNAAATNVYNVYAGGTAQNYFAGDVTIGTSLRGGYSGNGLGVKNRLTWYPNNWGNSTTDYLAWMNMDASANVFYMQTLQNNGTNSGSISMQPYGGNVGIGTTDPGNYKLLAQATTFGIIGVQAGGSNQEASLDLISSYSTSNQKNWNLQSHQGNFKINLLNDARTSATNMLTINSTGTVGIGTTSPSSKLEITSGGTAAENGYGTVRVNVTPNVYASGGSTGTAIGLMSNTSFANQGATAQLALIQRTANVNDINAGVYLSIKGWFQNSATSLPIAIGGGHTGITPSIFIVGAGANGGGNVGIGTTDPGNDKLQINEPSNADLNVGIIARGANSRRAQLTFGVLNSSGTTVGGSIGSSGTRGGGLVLQGNTDPFSNGAVHFFISADGETRLRAPNSTEDKGAYNLQVNGTGVWGAGPYVDGSDSTLKFNIKALSFSTEVLKKLRPVTYNYKPSYNKDTSLQVGFIAQEVQEALKNTDYVNGVVRKGSTLSMAYQSLIPLLTKALQESIDRIEFLEKKISILEQKIVKY